MPRQLPGASRLQVRADDPTRSEVAQLLREHLDHMVEITPPESVHTLDLEDLRSPDVSFWTAWEGGELLGCGALKKLDSKCGEVKSMHTTEVHRGRGVASKILETIVEAARRRGYECLNLETGASPAFASARAFYARHGFEYRGPFANYSDDPNSVFMTKRLRPESNSASTSRR